MSFLTLTDIAGFEANVSDGWIAALWLVVIPTKRRAVCAQPHFRVTAAQAILKSLGWRFCSMAKLVFGLSQSLDGYVDHLEISAPISETYSKTTKSGLEGCWIIKVYRPER